MMLKFPRYGAARSASESLVAIACLVCRISSSVLAKLYHYNRLEGHTAGLFNFTIHSKRGIQEIS